MNKAYKLRNKSVRSIEQIKGVSNTPLVLLPWMLLLAILEMIIAK